MKVMDWHYGFIYYALGRNDTKVYRWTKVQVRKWWLTPGNVDTAAAANFKNGFDAGRLDMWYEVHAAVEKIRV